MSQFSVALYAADTWTLTQTYRRLEAFDMWIWRSMEKISWLDKVLTRKFSGESMKTGKY